MDLLVQHIHWQSAPPKARTEPGIWALPDGDARYAFRVKESTTTNLTPEEIHQLGLAEVKAIEARILEV